VLRGKCVTLKLLLPALATLASLKKLSSDAD
jgi:hypothetical protein